MAEQRTLRSSQLRNVLWMDADGKCQSCGCELDPDNWHADHIVPWNETKRTNVHEMQALCPTCNLKKGCKMLRKHQAEFQEIIEKLKAGYITTPRRILAVVTPGGGKSYLPMIAAKHLIPSFADKICWVVPRTSLADQAEVTFAEHQADLGLPGAIRWAANRPNLTRGHIGYVTTYQAIGADADLHAYEFDRHRYILVLDEPHHVTVGWPWHTAMTGLVDRCKLLVLMSGTLEKANANRIAFVDYQPDGVVDLQQSAQQQVVRYTRIDALEEGAIVPVEFEHLDSAAEWIDSNGEKQQRDTFDGANDEEARAMIFTSLTTGYARDLLKRGVEHWLAFRKHSPWSQLLIVSRDIDAAERDAECAKHFIGEEVAIATDRDNPAARQNIKAFCNGDIKALATVYMAYEGMDARAVTHLICLTNIRSKPWIEQMIGRVVRTYPGKSRGFVFCPDDPLMNAVIDAIRDEQIAAARIDIEPAELGGTGSKAKEPLPSGTIPLSSQSTDARVSSFDASVELTPGQLRWLDSMGLAGVSRERLAGVFDAVLRHGSIPEVEADPICMTSTPSQREKDLKDRIEERCRRIDRERHGCDWGTTNGEIVKRFGKKRPAMNEAELAAVWAWINRLYPEN